jgi:hypothetical protein
MKVILIAALLAQDYGTVSVSDTIRDPKTITYPHVESTSSWPFTVHVCRFLHQGMVYTMGCYDAAPLPPPSHARVREWLRPKHTFSMWRLVELGDGEGIVILLPNGKPIKITPEELEARAK